MSPPTEELRKRRRQRRRRQRGQVCEEPRPLVEQWIDAYWRTGDIHMDSPDSPFAGCIIKIAEGGGYLTESRKNWAYTQVMGAESAGKRWQYYAYARPDLRPDLSGADSEVEAMLQALDRMPPPNVVRYCDGSDVAVWIDLEADHVGTPKPQAEAWILRWLEGLESEGFPCGLYVSDRWLDEWVGLSDATMARLFTREDGSRRGLWVARYGKNDGAYPPDLVAFPPSEKAPNWHLVNRGWPPVQQWTSNRSTPGIADGHDSNLVYLAP